MKISDLFDIMCIYIYIYMYVPAGREMVPACKGNIIPRIKTHSEEDSLLELVKCNSSMCSLILCKPYLYDIFSYDLHAFVIGVIPMRLLR